MKSITKIYSTGTEEKSIGEAIVLSLLDITVASMFGIAADILAATIDITSALSDKIPDTSMKVNYISRKGDDCMTVYKSNTIEYVVSTNMRADSKEEKKCIKRIQSKRF